MKLKTLFATLVSLAMLSAARADIAAIGNLTTTASGSRTYSDTDWLAIAFHTGDHPTETGWTNFSLTVQTHDGSWPVGGEIQLWWASAGEPGGKDKSYTLPGTQPSGGLVTVTDTSTFKLLENTDYFLVIDATSGSADTDVTDDSAVDAGSASGWTLGNLWLSSDAGGNWTENTGNDRMQVSIGVDAIPEPAVITLVALLGGGLLVIRRTFML